jgi:hypothetical protein
MKEGPGSVYDKWNISMVICDTDSPYQSTKSNVGALVEEELLTFPENQVHPKF